MRTTVLDSRTTRAASVVLIPHRFNQQVLPNVRLHRPVELGRGYLGVAALMFAENAFPPIPSELIMPFAGFVAARDELSFAAVILAGSLGLRAGVHVWYEIDRVIGAERLERWAGRHGRWLGVSTAAVRGAGD